jgi:hypothetical protein
MSFITHKAARRLAVRVAPEAGGTDCDIPCEVRNLGGARGDPTGCPWYSVSPRRTEAIQFRGYLDLPVLLARKLVKLLLPGCLAAVATVLQTNAAVFTDQPSAG